MCAETLSAEDAYPGGLVAYISKGTVPSVPAQTPDVALCVGGLGLAGAGAAVGKDRGGSHFRERSRNLSVAPAGMRLIPPGCWVTTIARMQLKAS